MSFFQHSVLNKHLKSLDKVAVSAAYAKFKTYFHNSEIQQNIREAKEEQFQEGFLRELFVEVLGYTLNPQPNYNLTTEFKNEVGARKADGAILKDGKALAVIELKGTDTKDLDKVNKQAFDYKNNQTGCIYVITSNFEKLRFFIDNSVDHIEFNLFTLTEEEFELLWLCLQAENLFGGLPQKAKEQSLLADENITKQLYKDYSAFKYELWQNISKNLPDNDQLLLFKKSQKLLDRFLFILFAEDSGLLPPNSISRIVERWEILKEEDAYKPLYEIFKQYFGYINTGRKGKTQQGDIFAYNGGLFYPDVILDSLVIDDDVLLRHVKKLTVYNFQSEVDVNILGHIFENSLTEIENITAKLEGQEVEKTKTKRKKDGVFYTPKYITKYIVANTVGKLCAEKKDELNITDERFAEAGRRTKKGIADLEAYRKWLLELKICDPACGSGAFLNQALNFFLKEHRYLDELVAQYHGASLVLSDIENQILENNLYGVDINEESVEIAKLSLWLRTAQRGRTLTTLNNNIKCGNSLIDDPEIAGEKAFDWQNEFPTVFNLGGFDVVIGNPPYGASFGDWEKQYLKKKFKNSTTGKIDSYRIFIEKAMQLANSNSLISYIVPNTFLYNVQSLDLRRLVLDNTEIYDTVELRKNIFEDAPDVVTVIFSLKNSLKDSYSFRARVAYHNVKYYDIDNSVWVIDQNIPLSFLKKDKDLKINLRSNIAFDSINEKLRNQPKLGDYFNLRQGTKPYGQKENKEVELIVKGKNEPNWEKALNGRNISRYHLEFEDAYVHRCDFLHSVIEPEIVQGEKIYFQRMRKISLFPRVVACYDNNNYHGLYNMFSNF